MFSHTLAVPLHGTGTACGEAQGPLALLYGGTSQLVVAPAAVGVPSRLVAGFAGDVGHAGAFGRDGVPKQRIVLPVSMVCGKCHTGGCIKLIQEPVRDATLVLTNVDKLGAACVADGGDKGVHPAGEHVLRKEVVVQRAHAVGVFVARVAHVFKLGQGNLVPAAQLPGRNAPRICKHSEGAVAFLQPLLPVAHLHGIVIGHIAVEDEVGV
jgi:hypothetical protein